MCTLPMSDLKQMHQVLKEKGALERGSKSKEPCQGTEVNLNTYRYCECMLFIAIFLNTCIVHAILHSTCIYEAIHPFQAFTS